MTDRMTDPAPDFTLHPDLLRDSLPVGSFPLCDVRMVNDATYPWFLLIPRRAGLRDVVDLDGEDYVRMWEESRQLGAALMRAFGGEKLNVAALGNMTPQLHIHHVVRFAADPAWPGPIWGVVPMRPYAPDDRSDTTARVCEALPGDAFRAHAGKG